MKVIFKRCGQSHMNEVNTLSYYPDALRRKISIRNHKEQM